MATIAVEGAAIPAQATRTLVPDARRDWRPSMVNFLAVNGGQFSQNVRKSASSGNKRSTTAGFGASSICHSQRGELRCFNATAVTVGSIIKGSVSARIDAAERGKRWEQGRRYGGMRILQTRRGYRSRSQNLSIKAMDASVGGQGQEDFGPPPPFPRLGVRDPYKLLGVSRDASTEEIREAHNYLSNQYWGHEKSKEAIEAAYDKIIMESFRDRKNSKINLKSSLKKKVSEAPPQIRALTNMIEIPPSQTIGQRAALFILLGVWSVMNPADGGPAFQVAVSLAACIYFLNDRLKSLGRAFLLGFGALVVGWVSGSFLVPVLSSYILPPSWNLELSTALFSYIFLWAACTFLK